MITLRYSKLLVLAIILAMAQHPSAQNTSLVKRLWASPKEIALSWGNIGFLDAPSSLNKSMQSKIVFELGTGLRYPLEERLFLHTGLGLGYLSFEYHSIWYAQDGFSSILSIVSKVEDKGSFSYVEASCPILMGVQAGKQKAITIGLGVVPGLRVLDFSKIKQTRSLYSEIEINSQLPPLIAGPGNGPPVITDINSAVILLNDPSSGIELGSSSNTQYRSFDAKLPSSRFQLAATARLGFELPFRNWLRGTSMDLQGFWYLTNYDIWGRFQARYRLQAGLSKVF